MNIFLTSQASRVLDKIVEMLPKPPRELRVAFIPTASDPYEEHPWLDEDRAKFIELGFNVIDFDLKYKTEDETRQALKNFDILFVAGGNTFYLLSEARKSGFCKVAKEMVEAGKIYIGSSAGSYIACPTIEAATWKNPEKERFGLVDLRALCFVDFILTAHYKDKYKDAVAEGKKTSRYRVVVLTDEQFVDKDGKIY
ncbi:MAG: Type 1 glutamine amidotransferase-like domain-containing protein [Patescibacteria group bacterium]